jgi:PST family polysaccharide transporter
VTIRAISLLVFSTIKVLLIVNGAGVQAFAWATSGELALSALLLWGITSRQGVPFTLAGVRRDEMKELLRSSWPLAISSLSVILYMRTDQVMLGQLLDDRAVGVFSAAVRISESWYFVPMAMLTAVAPALTAAHHVSEEDYRARLLTSIRLIVWASILLAACIMLASGPIVSVLFGPEYEQAKTVLAIHAWAGVFAGLGVASSPWFVNAGLLGLRMTFTIAGALMNIGLNALAIPRFGVYGAAVVTLLSYAVSGFLLNAITSRTRPVFFMQLRALFLR